MTIKVTYNITDVYVTQDVSPVYINVSYSSGGGSGAAVWGGITGTLSDQTDLQTALDGKFDDPTGTSLQYIDGTGALQTFPLTLPVLQEVRNQTGATLDAGTVVYINGATGNKPTVTKAIATGDATSAQTLGMVSAAIANNGTGYVVVIGTCSGLDTSAYTEGQQLYLSYTTAGAVTTTKPYAPNHLVYIGIVTRAHPTLGTVEVRVQNGYELDEIHDVDALNPNNNDGIFYNSTTSLWEHKQISTALGYTPANAATTLTINGVTYDLSANRTWTISAGISGSGASGQVAYWTGTSAQSGSNNLFWDNANGRLGIGTNVPDNPVTINLPMGTNNSGLGFVVKKGTGYFLASNGTSAVNNFVPFFLGVPNYDAFGIAFQGNLFNTTSVNPALLFQSYNLAGSAAIQNSQITFAIANGATRLINIYGNGNLILQNGGTFTDSGERLQVTGTMKVTGASTFGGNMTLSLNQDNITQINVSNTSNSTNSRSGIRLDSDTNSGVGIFQKTSTSYTTYKTISGKDLGIYNSTSGGNISILNDFATGNINFAAGGSSTAHLTIKSNGRINMSSLPTSSTGLATGDLWNDAGTIKIV